MELRLQDITREKIFLKIKLFIGTMLLHAVLRLANFYPNDLYLFLTMVSLILVLTLCLEINHPDLAQALKAAFLGSLPPIFVAILMPRHFLFSICANFMALQYGFSELKWRNLLYLFSSNTLSWIVCNLYYDSIAATTDPAVAYIKGFFEDQHLLSQVVLGIVINYVVLILSSAEKYVDNKTQQQYESTLLKLNSDLEITNIKLKNSNKELQEALQEKENFILRFSHEIRNPLNSLLGNIELCYEQAVDQELEQMLKDAKVSGEILLQLLNNVLDTAKVAVGRLEVSISPQNIRNFLERAWIICSEIIRKKRLYGCLSVNMDVPEVLEIDHHRLMQILINTISNAAKFTDKGHVKVHVDFIEGSEINNEDMSPKYGIFPQSPETVTTYMNEEDFNEKPKFFFESLTLNHKRFQGNSRLALSSLKSQADMAEIPSLSKEVLRRRNEQDQEISYQKSEISCNLLRTPLPSLSGPDEPKEGFLRFEIIDTGCGISKQCLENAFKKFQQVNANSSKRQIGTGLGLWITKEIVEMMNGKIEVCSEVNRGTVIVFMVKSKSKIVSRLLNESSPQKNLAPRTTSVDSNRTGSSRVLIVEDIQYNQEVNRRLLKKCKVVNMTIANNGQEAVEIFLKKGPKYFDLILMDIDMPVMDGKTAVKIIRKEERNRRWEPVNIVFLTGFSESKTQKELLDESGEYRANGFYSKPASLDTFKLILKDCSSSRKDYDSDSGLNEMLCAKEISKKSSFTNLKDPLKNHLVLVVDDDSFNLSMVTKMLKLYKINTLEARNGQEAIQIYEENWKRISCILMDCEMPVLDGLEATQRILAKHNQRAALLGKRMSIYGLTGHVGREYRERCLEVGMKDVLEKPIKIEVLSTLLRDS